jgi:hypothetical protein
LEWVPTPSLRRFDFVLFGTHACSRARIDECKPRQLPDKVVHMPARTNNPARVHMFPTSHAPVLRKLKVPNKCCSRDRGRLNMKEAKTADCRRMAQRMSAHDRAALLRMAEVWERQAQEAEKRAKADGKS